MSKWSKLNIEDKQTQMDALRALYGDRPSKPPKVEIKPHCELTINAQAEGKFKSHEDAETRGRKSKSYNKRPSRNGM